MAQQPNFRILADAAAASAGQLALMPNLPAINFGEQLGEIQRTLVEMHRTMQQQGQQLTQIREDLGQLREEQAQIRQEILRS